jgi:hypothetical protein
MIKKFALGLAISCTAIAPALAQITFDGNITEAQWGSPIQTSAGGPAPGFGAGHEINAIYASADQFNIFFGLAGNVQNGNHIVLLLDTEPGGYNTGNFGRTDAPAGFQNINSGITFDAGFNADFALVISTNPGHDDFFFDLYTLSGTAGNGGGPNSFLGSANLSSSDMLGANPANSSNTAGFEFAISKAVLGYQEGQNIGAFALYISDSGFLSNQFLTRANPDQGNFGDGAVNFNNEPPNAFAIGAELLVPEPSTLSLLAGPALLGAWFFIRRRRA